MTPVVDLGPLRRILRSVGANVYGQAVVIVVQLAGVPILLHAWGAQLYGEWLILSAIPAYLSMTDLGFANSGANDMTHQVGRGDRAKALAVFQSLGALVLCATAVGLLLTIIFVFGLPLKSWLNTAVISGAAARWVILFLAAEAFVRLIEGVGNAGFRACGEFSLYGVVYYSTYLLQSVAVWCAALLGLGPVEGAALFLIVRLAATPLVALLLRSRHPWLKFGFAHAHRSELRRLLAPATANVSWALAQALGSQGMILTVAGFLGPVAVVVFSTLRTLTRLVLQVVLTVSNAAEPELAAAYGANDGPLIRTILIHTTRAGIWLALTGAAGLALLGPWIFAVWTHGKIQMDIALFDWLLLTTVASVLWYTAVTMLRAANRHIRATLLYCVISAVALGAGAGVLATTHRLADVGIVLFAAEAAMIVYTLRAVVRLVGGRADTYLLQAINPLPILRAIRRGVWRGANV